MKRNTVSIDSLARSGWRWHGLVRPLPGLATLRKVAANLTLAQKFAVLCLVILVAGALVLGRLVATEIRENVMHRTSSTVALYVESVVSPHLQELSNRPTMGPQSVAAMDTVVKNPAFREKIVSVKIWSPAGAVAYATDQRLVGQDFPDNAELQTAFGGSITTELSSLKDSENVFERAAWPSLLETYVPVREHGTGRIIAVAEFYQDPSELLAEVNAAQRRAWMIVGFATVGMYLALSTLVAGGSRTITRQNRRLERSVKELTSLQSQNAALQERVLRAASEKAETDERLMSRIAHDLHDGPAQNMAVALLRLDAVHQAMTEDRRAGNLTRDLHLMRTALDASLKELRSLSAGLSLPELDAMSLEDTVRTAIKQHEQLTGSRVLITSDELPPSVPMAAKIAIFRVLQEALNNAHQHGGCADQTVKVRYLGRSVLLEISDRGKGFDLAITQERRPGGGLGLPGMRERVELLGGALTVVSKVGEGTRVTASVPIDQRA